MNKKLSPLLILTTVLIGLTVTSKGSLAVEELNPSPSSEGTVSGILDEKVDGLREEVRKRVEEKLKNIVDQQTKRGWIGTVEKKDKLSFTLKSNNSSGTEIRPVTISDDVEIVGDDRKKITLDQIAEGQRVVAMGYLQVDGSLEAKRIVLIDKPEDRGIEPIFGTITDISKEKQILSITPLSNDDNAYEVIVDSDSVLKQKDTDKKIKYKDLRIDQKVVAILIVSKDNSATHNAKTILIISSPPEPSPTPTPTKTQE